MGGVSPFSSLHTAFSGLQAAQIALDITSKNISSVGVEGYSRQRVDTQGIPETASSWYLSPPTGVEVRGYERLRDKLLDRRYYDQAPLSGDAETRSSILGQVEGALQEPSDYGLNSLLSRFWNSWQSVANTPTSTPARQSVINAAQGLASGIRELSQSMQTTLNQLADEQTTRTAEVNDMAANIVRLTDNIRQTLLQGGSPSSLQDERDVALDNLAKLGNLQVTHSDDGNISVRFGTFDLISSGVAATASLVDLNTASSGRMFALQDLAGSVLPGLQAKLNATASALITQVNTQHAAGYDLSGTAGGPVFSGSSAADIALDATWAANPGKLALSDSPTGRGSNANALALAGVGERAGTVGTESINGSYSSMVAQIGSLVSSAKNQERVQSALLGAVQDQRSSVSGVSLDEEMSNLIKYQQSYAAAARVISAIDQMLDILITRTGRVGV